MLSELSQRDWVDKALRQRLSAAAEGAATHLLALANTAVNGTLVSLCNTFCSFVCVVLVDIHTVGHALFFAQHARLGGMWFVCLHTPQVTVKVQLIDTQ